MFGRVQTGRDGALRRRRGAAAPRARSGGGAGRVGRHALVCTTANLQDSARAWLTERAVLVERANYGYDFFSYKVGLDAAGDLTAYDEVVVCNDTYVFALDSYEPVFDEMATGPATSGA